MRQIAKRATSLFRCLSWSAWIACLCLSLTPTRGFAQSDEDQPAGTGSSGGHLNWRMATLGGKQFWTDFVWVEGWRIQQNALTGHWRLLNPNNVRYAWGSREACAAALEQQGIRHQIASQEVIILMHGLMRSASSMHGLEKYLSKKSPATIITFEYASTRGSIATHAAALRELIAGLPPDVQLKFVGHSMGNIVLRHAIGDWQRADDTQTLQQLESVVMLGPPNQGASIARQLSRTGVFSWVVGAGGMELGPKWEEFESQLAVPPCPFGIVAGRLPESYFQNPLVEGASDFVVSVEEARLEGSSQMLEVPQLHSFLMDDPTVRQAVYNFLDHHSFED